MTSPSQTTKDDFTIRLGGRFHGGSYKITRHGPSAFLSITLADDASLVANQDDMVAKSHGIVYKENFRFKLRKLLNDDPFFEYSFIGPGELLLAPSIWGDIVPIHLDGKTEWTIGKNGPLAMTDKVVKETRSQPIFQNLLHREAIFVYRVSGIGVVFVPSLGSMQQHELKKDDILVVNNGSLVAWNCRYEMKDTDTGDSIFCHFEGPGVVITQGLNALTLLKWSWNYKETKENIEETMKDYPNDE
ncbi:unnamed protein product [Rotaria magnacalcarata]|nr:unnamed protein product [Rotaria magnacalcarata]CAF4179027.1 unnamed protein product [Rotaria magnacalcarata]